MFVWRRLCVESFQRPFMCNEWKGLFCLLVYKYKLLNIVFLFLPHRENCFFLYIYIRQQRLQIFWGILCCSEAIQVYLKNTFHCEYYADGCTGHFLMFILSLVHFTSCSRACEFYMKLEFLQKFVYELWKLCKVQKLRKCNC